MAKEDKDTRSRRLRASMANVPRRLFPAVTVLRGPQADMRLVIDQRETWIGRDEGCGVCLTDGQTSRRHAVIVYTNIGKPEEEPACLVRDNGSTNGTLVNEKRVDEAPLRDRDRISVGGTVIGFSLTDTLELDADERLYRRATTDGLTGLRNRHAFDAILQIEFSRARRYSRNLSVMMIDIDHFKNTNDRYGHQAGDETLRQLSRLISVQAREGDTVCRYGGEEIVIVMPESDGAAAGAMAERLRRSVEGLRIAFEEEVFGLTVSIGVAHLTEETADAEALVAAADAAMYEAKADGRNRTVARA